MGGLEANKRPHFMGHHNERTHFVVHPNKKKTFYGPPPQRAPFRKPNMPTQNKSMEINSNCSMCNNPHPLELCSRFKALNAEQRIAHCKLNRSYFICLGRGHMTRYCQKAKNAKCQTCMSTRHHTLIHIQMDTTPKMGPQGSIMGGSPRTESGNPSIKPS
jgi:hypothetical protein